ncbi:MAG: Do family serine endopeptidase [Hyphomicrobiales bacterium]|nr:Do family serine endopeptidase [Hyphomicrobiales bacterium]
MPGLSLTTRLGALAGAVAIGATVLHAWAPPVVAQGRIGPQSIAPLAERLIDAVVNISTTQTVKGSDGVPLPKVPKGSPFEEFFEDFFNKRGRGSQPDRKASSLGSGFVIDAKEGFIVTNNHVIDGADEIIANFHDGSRLKVERIVGKDTKSDLALLKVTPGKKPLVAVPFGSSTKMRVGDWVMAIGNPFGLDGSVSVGIISSKEREVASQFDEYLQTDAAINRGNSGGPLFNMEGEVIGVNTAIISPTGGSVGIGFAVPSDTAKSIIEQLRLHGEARRGWLGVKIRSVTEDIAESLGIPENSGALIESVTANGPAAKGGISEGDVVLRFDGKDISTLRGLPRVVAQTPVGKEVDVEVLRKGQKRSVKVVVGRLTDDSDRKADAVVPERAPTPTPNARKVEDGLAGVKLAAMDEALRRRFGIDPKVKGVVITEVDPTSPSAQKELKAGDVIVEAANEPVTTPDDVTKAIDKVRKAGRKAVLLRLESAKGELRFVAVPMP